MGYRVRIAPKDKRVFRMLRESPSEVFDKSYVGYMFFLVGRTDSDILYWLSDNVITLDSLTADIVAFAIFARSFKMKVHTSDSSGQLSLSRRRFPTTVEVPLERLRSWRSVERMIEMELGRVDWFINGDEINAITYAVDDIARSFGVIDELPCVLLLDAIPTEEFEIIPLDMRVTRQLIPLLRRVERRLLDSPDYVLFRQTLKEIVQLQEEMRGIQESLRDLEILRDNTYPKAILVRIEKTLAEIRASMGTKRAKSVISRNQNQPELLLLQEDLERVRKAIIENHDTLSNYNNTLLQLYRYQTKNKWPLKESLRSEYLEICNEQVRELVSNYPKTIDVDSPEQCKELRKMLIRERNLLVDQIMGDLLEGSALEEIADKTAREIKTSFDTQIEELQEIEEEAAEAIQKKIEALRRMSGMSFTNVFVKELGKLDFESKKRRVKEGAKAYAGSWLSPEILVKVWQALSSTP